MADAFTATLDIGAGTGCGSRCSDGLASPRTSPATRLAMQVNRDNRTGTSNLVMRAVVSSTANRCVSGASTDKIRRLQFTPCRRP